ncbi:hypothetical protein D357_00269 [Enterococcus faecium SD3B-2]|nr:hypothetical protein D357_00269 [Enterococcus faecium SD3B-2]
MYKERLGTYRKIIKIRNKAFTKKEIHAIITNNETDCTKETRK